MRFLLFEAARSDVVCSLASSSIFDNKSVVLRDRSWMCFSTVFFWLWCSFRLCLCLFASSFTRSIDFFSTLNCSKSFSLSCLIWVIMDVRFACSLSFRSFNALNCSCLSCSLRVDMFKPRISFSTASSCSACSVSACCTFCRASSRRCMPISDDRHCCTSCFFSNSMLSISRDASLRVAMAASDSCFCAASWASSNARCSVRRLSSSFMRSMR
mmetsp:Transcript_57425/g.134678  ORF Transcript_57425/g.134678 Transcript_57425/m.134678 type:complete len:213 (-) Transcript_57425:633-1271(-)